MSDFAGLISRIADDTNRTDINSQISQQIQGAIRHYRKFPFWFNEEVTTLTASNSATALTVPSDYLETVELYINVANFPLRMKKSDLDDVVGGRPPTGSQPNRYCYYKDRLELNCQVNQEYTFPLYYIKELATLSASSDSNLWTTTGEDLIVFRAEKMLYANTLKDIAQAKVASEMERDARNSLLGFRDQKIGTGQAKPWGY